MMRNSQVETRSRSRSKTPYLRSSRDYETSENATEEEHIHHVTKKVQVATSAQLMAISEENVKVTSSSSSISRSANKAIQNKMHSSEEQKNHAMSTGVIKMSPTSTTVEKSATETLEHIATSSSPYFLSDEKHRQLNFTHKENSLSPKNKRLPYFGLADDDEAINDHIAYLEYKHAGEYWKKTPKTDYTYSELSPHRRVLAPGVVAMPNMSRQGLENHHERINFLINRNPNQEEFIRRRYQLANIAERRNFTERLIGDSADELDYTQHQATWLMRLFMKLVTTITTVWTTITRSSSKHTKVYDASRMNASAYLREDRGFFYSIAHVIATSFGRLARYLYFFISSVLVLDTWLLKSSKADNRGKKRFFFFLLLGLLLFLMAAWALLDENDRTNILQGTQALIPLSLLGSAKNILENSGTFLKSSFQTSINHRASDSVISNKRFQIEKGQAVLTPMEHENLLNHVQQLIDSRVLLHQQQFEKITSTITPQQSELIAQFISDHLEHLVKTRRTIFTHEVKLVDLNENEVQRLSEQICQRFKTMGYTICEPSHLTKRTELSNKDLDNLLIRVMNAPQMNTYIHAHINSAVAAQLLNSPTNSGDAAADQLTEDQALIKDLGNEIASIKLSLSDNLSENENLQQKIQRLKISEENLLNRIREHEQSTENRIQTLRGEVFSKFVDTDDNRITNVNKQIELRLAEILGFNQASSDGVMGENVDLQSWVRSMFVTKESLEERLLKLSFQTNDIIRKEIDRSVVVLMRDITERIKRDITSTTGAKEIKNMNDRDKNLALSEKEILRIVNSVLATYDADKTGLVDYALESAGGQVLSTRCTENYQVKSAQISVFGIPLWYPSNTPRVAISPPVHPGECWAFQGFPGFMVLKLNSMVYITGFTLEHIPKTLSPNGKIDSAPGNFTVWGLVHEKDQEPVMFGEYEYLENGAPMQHFQVQNADISRPHEIVELRIESNHGNPKYTCLYRFRVHGKLTP